MPYRTPDCCYESKYKCSKCGHDVKWEHDGGDYTIEPCPWCMDKPKDEGWDECRSFNDYPDTSRIDAAEQRVLLAKETSCTGQD